MERTRRLHLGVEETGCHVCPDWPMILQVDSLWGGSSIEVIMNVVLATIRKRSGSVCPRARLGSKAGLWLAGFMIVVLGFGCRRAPTSVPAAPPNAIEAIVEGMRNHQPQVVWHALPPSYQQDVKVVITTFCDNMDAEVYNRGFRILGKVVQVMREKEDLIAKSPIILSMPLIESRVGQHWGEDVALLNTIAQSDLSSLEKLGRMDPGKFLASTGPQVMDALEKFRESMQRSPGEDPWEKARQALKSADIQFAATDDTHGLLTFGSSGKDKARKIKLTKVEDRWVPADMAERWPERISKALEDMTKLSGPEFEKFKPMIWIAMGAVEGMVDRLLRAETQQQFDEALKGLESLGTTLRSMRPPQ